MCISGGESHEFANKNILVYNCDTQQARYSAHYKLEPSLSHVH